MKRERPSVKMVSDKCTDCIYDPLSGGTRTAQIEGCLDDKCALWPARPLTSATRDVMKQERIAKMTPDERIAYEKKAEIARIRFAETRSNSLI